MMTQKNIAYSFLVLLALVFIFHSLVFVGVIPYSIVWGGRLTSVSQMRVFESVSFLMNIFMVLVILSHAKIITVLPEKVTRICIWFLIVMFALNTVGNLASTSQLEKIIFTPLTAISVVMLYLLVRKK